MKTEKKYKILGMEETWLAERSLNMLYYMPQGLLYSHKSVP